MVSGRADKIAAWLKKMSKYINSSSGGDGCVLSNVSSGDVGSGWVSYHKQWRRLALVHRLSGAVAATGEQQDVVTNAALGLDGAGVYSGLVLSGARNIDMTTHIPPQQLHAQLHSAKIMVMTAAATGTGAGSIATSRTTTTISKTMSLDIIIIFTTIIINHTSTTNNNKTNNNNEIIENKIKINSMLRPRSCTNGFYCTLF